MHDQLKDMDEKIFEKLDNFTSLIILHIEEYSSLISLLKELGNLTSLTKLDIEGQELDEKNNSDKIFGTPSGVVPTSSKITKHRESQPNRDTKRVVSHHLFEEEHVVLEDLHLNCVVLKVVTIIMSRPAGQQIKALELNPLLVDSPSPERHYYNEATNKN
uniref:Uncharacterized protein n=1 Tax=Physcomitrium patens TaxID=3218 RepID=A0A2K1ITP4_PHYPA|nr:hypothetical protein PHYPA_024591 [Physcomitrium patens]